MTACAKLKSESIDRNFFAKQKGEKISKECKKALFFYFYTQKGENFMFNKNTRRLYLFH